MNVRFDKPTAQRFLACLAGGFVLALMIGDQEGTQTDFGIAFREAVSMPRLLIFLLLGVALFIAMTFWPYIAPYLKRPGAAGVAVGFLITLISLLLMNWYDPVGKFGPLSDKVADTSGLGALPSAFFGWLGWTLWVALFVLGAVAVVLHQRVLGYVVAALGVVAAILTFLAQMQLVDFAGGIDHSLGVYVACIGFLVSAGAGLVVALSKSDVAAPTAFVVTVLTWRPGLVIAVVGCVVAAVAFASASWFSPLQLNRGFSDLYDTFNGTSASAFSLAYVQWLALVLVIAAALVTLAAAWLRSWLLGAVATVLGLVGVVTTLVAMHDISAAGVKAAPNYGKIWQNLGTGGWVAAIGFGLLAAAGGLVVSGARTAAKAGNPPKSSPVDALPMHAAVKSTSRSTAAQAVIPVALVVALFYPQTLTTDWQTTLVTEIGPYLLLAVGLNVVVGWAGLLDLGYIAFYGIGSYTTAYITGSLPLKPPSWLLLSPLWAIPFAIVACLIAGVLLGAPTLRLRGDYLAIVTLGFGEIIQVVAINNPGNLTGGPTGPTVPNPVLNIGPIHVHWGLDNMPYWYLLLVLLIIVVILFYRLEGSRLGRAWAAIREDEVAAQATGINTTKVKLLAFSIGASTSGLAGVFYATQVGYFDPQSFTLQNSILIVAYVVFGGMGSLPGAIAGAAALTWLPQFLKAQVPLQDRQMWIGAIVLAMMIFRPAGLIPARRRAAELDGLDAPASSEVRAVPAGEGM
jgi:ABC-type branched-subunit amino acid transport system permease subunit